MTDPESRPSTDAVLHAIADRQRRVVLRELASEARASIGAGEAEEPPAGSIEEQFPESTSERSPASTSERSPASTETRRCEPAGALPTEETGTESPDDSSTCAADDLPVAVAVELLEEAVARTRMASDAGVRSSAEIAIQLRHVHLPTLEDAGLVRYDPERGRVEYCPNELVESLLAFIERHGRPSPSH